jgi:hypothetical protein
LIQLLIGENAQPRFSIHDRKLHCPIENSDYRLVVVNRRDELGGGQAFE